VSPTVEVRRNPSLEQVLRARTTAPPTPGGIVRNDEELNVHGPGERWRPRYGATARIGPRAARPG